MSKEFENYEDIEHLFLNPENSGNDNIPYDSSDTVIIYPPTINWNWMMQRPQHLMEQFSLHGFTVYYCNMTQSQKSLYTVINPNLTIIHNNNYFINKIVPELKRAGKKIILWVSWAKLGAFAGMYTPDYVIYDYLDDFSAWKPYLHMMVERADLIITTSQVLEDQIRGKYPSKSECLVPNGCDIEHFKNGGITDCPDELKDFNGPVITYSGAWASWIDQELIYDVAASFEQAMILIIGTEFGRRMRLGLPNIKFIGYKPYDELPAYYQRSSAFIIPFVLNQITVATSPIKMYEYLAAGKPVVSTDIPEARRLPAVLIGRSHYEFIEKLRSVLERRFVFDNKMVDNWLLGQTWEKRFESIQSAMKARGII